MAAEAAPTSRVGGLSGGRLLALQALVSVLALGGVAWWGTHQSLPALPSAGEAAGPLAGALAVYAVAMLLRAERWYRLLGIGDVRAPRSDAYALTAVGYMGNNALPARAGDVMKAMLSATSADAPRRDAFGALVAERLLDAVALLVIFVGLVAAAGLPLGVSRGVFAVLLGVLAVAALSVALVGRRSSGSAHRVWLMASALLAPTRRLAGTEGATAFALSLAIWLTEGAIYAIVGSVAGVPLSFSDGLYVMALANIAAMVPAAPGYVGTYDAAVLLGVRLVRGGGASVALPYVVLVRFVLFVPVTVVGLVALLTRYGGLRTARMALRSPSAT